MVITINPATGEKISEFAELNAVELGHKIDQTQSSFVSWRELEVKERLECVIRLSDKLDKRKKELSELMTLEMGKPLRESLFEVEKSIKSLKVLVNEFPRWLAQQEYETANGYQVRRTPLGVILGIMPWNFPLWQVIRFAVPAIICGNTVLLKHAPNTWGTAELIDSIFALSFPQGVYSNLRIPVSMVEGIIQDSRVHGVSLTGSKRAGESVGQIAGKNLKKCILELGGSDPYLILEDADIKKAAEACAAARLQNNGQSCIAGKRFIVVNSRYEDFANELNQVVSKKIVGDPMLTNTDVGPLARVDLKDELDRQVVASVKKGAKVIFQSGTPMDSNCYYPITILTEVLPGMPAFDEELFGPVFSVIRASNENHAIELANRSQYGLGAAIFSGDVKRAEKIAVNELEVGMVAINDFVRSDVFAPFGGVKASGLGRELGKDGVFEFTNIKSVFVPSKT